MKIHKKTTHLHSTVRLLRAHFVFTLCFALLAAGLSTSAQSRLDGPILQLLAHASPASPQETADSAAPENTNTPPAKKESFWNQPDNGTMLAIALDYRHPLTGNYESFYGGRVFLEMTTLRQHSAGMTLGAGVLRLESGSRADRAVHDAAVFDIGIYYRYYFTSAKTFLRPYGTFHFGVNTTIFDYRTDPVVGNKRVGRDSLGGGDYMVGVGVEAKLSDKTHFFGELGYGGVGFFDTTYQDLKNRSFRSFSYIGLKTGIAFRL
jgi:hypothetical protein